MPITRRSFLGSSLGAAAMGWYRPGFAQPAVTVSRITDRIALVAGAGANVVVARGDDAALLVDGGLPERAAGVLAAAAEASGSEGVAVLFNTNWRLEHTGLNDAVSAGGTRIIAHENTKLWMANDFDVPWEGRDYDPRPDSALPNDTFYTTGELEHAGEPVEYGYLAQAHTDGDIYVRFPNANVLVVSDLLAVDAYPVVDYVTGGWIGGMERATAALLDMTDATTRIVPAVGPVQSRAALESQLELCTAVREAVRDAYRSGHSFEEFRAAAPTRAFDATRGDPTLFLKLVYKGAWGHVRELGGGII